MNNDAIKNELKNKLPALAVDFQPLPSLATVTDADDNRSHLLWLTPRIWTGASRLLHAVDVPGGI